MVVAAIDLGTNTFHMLIAESDGYSFKVLHKERKWVFLAEYGLSTLHPSVLERAWGAMNEFKQSLGTYQVQQYQCVATEAFRAASNGMDFLNRVKRELNIEAKVISGNKEAELIFKGVRLALGNYKAPSLIMDIGGGSTEFILHTGDTIHWIDSFKAGVTYLYNRFVNSNPLSLEHQQSLETYLLELFQEMKKELQQWNPISLVGASGSFDVLEMMAGMQPFDGQYNILSISHFERFYQELLPTTLEDRLLIDSIPESRAKLIVTAFILIRVVLDLFPFKNIIISPYALKEGLISELIGG
ncbi:MAG TPA: hypothetical protein PKC30_14365 [Saprospiraceae bacterium]|nr:hypothetical protein [Saprospiraceae bacterium]